MLMVKLGYSTPNFKDMTPEQQEAMEANWPGLKKLVERRKKAYPDKWQDISSWEYGSQHRLHIEEAAALEEAGIPIEIEGVDGTMLTRMKDRNEKYGEKTPLEVADGRIVQIAIPDIGLLQITEVDWMEDACTEQLQRRLDDGWRVLAVCPPNAQRRPDYILGRSKQS